MRKAFSFILVLAIFGFIVSDKLRKQKVGLIAKAIKEVHDRNMKRKLQDTEPTNTPNINGTTEEGKNTTAPAEPISKDAPVSTKGTNVGKSDAGIQIMKFHNFDAKANNIKFGVFFFFLNRPIAMFVRFRLRVTKNARRLRNLDDDEPEAESVPTECKLQDEKLVDTVVETGKKVDYNCNATTDKIDASKSNITLNTDVDMEVEDKSGKTSSVDFRDVNFKGNSSEESSSLQEATNDAEKDVDLKDVELVNKDKNSFTLKGTAEPKGNINKGEKFDFLVSSNGKEQQVPVTCEVTNTNKDNGETTLLCSGENLDSKIKDFNGISGSGDGHDLNIEFKEGTNLDEPLQTGEYYPDSGNTNNRYYRKSSSGLSGGAIAGIVIACVVALAAASIAAIMLKKPAPPIDNTTAVGLKTVENI
jgi:hypothetical protein